MATEYVLLLQDADDGTVFHLRDVVEADNGPPQAVRRHTENDPDGRDGDEDVYVAVPSRNWSVVPRRVSVPAPRVTIEERDAAAFIREALAARRLAAMRDEPAIEEAE